ncbi:MAG: hypothetical protein LCI02_21595 [Proteobacteria bacterium]|nr:hypothetical protein [Pseudomonadota bacterium]
MPRRPAPAKAAPKRAAAAAGAAATAPKGAKGANGAGRVAGRALDPLLHWRELLTKTEFGVNKLAQHELESGRLSPLIGEALGVMVGLRHLGMQFLARVYLTLDLPSRSELQTLGAAVRRLEDKLELLLPTPPLPGPRPARTRQAPPPAASAAAPTTAPTTAPATAPASTPAKPPPAATRAPRRTAARAARKG